jgi:uncharacterized protein (DUF433 family)
MKNVILLVLTAFTVACSGCKSTSGDPKTVLNHFFDALARKDVNEAKKYVTKDSEGMMGIVEMNMKNMPDSNSNEIYKKENMIIGDPVITGDSATIPVKDKNSGEETDFVLKKESGDWKVAFDKSTLMDMTQKKMKEHGMGEMNSSSNENINEDSAQNRLNDSENADGKNKIDSAKSILEKMQKSHK